MPAGNSAAASTSLRDWKKGDRFSASHLQEPVNAIRAVQRFASGLPADLRLDPSESFPCVIVDKGPGGKTYAQTNAAAEQYWVKRQYIKGGKDRDQVFFGDELDNGAKQIELATNILESATGSHMLATGSWVWCWASWDGGVPSGVSQSQPDYRNHKRYFISANPRLQVKITGSASGGGKYNGVFWNVPTNDTDILATGDLAESDLGTTGLTCLVLNRREVGKSTHDLSSSTFLPLIFPADLIRINTGTFPVVAIDGYQWEDCT